MYLFEMKTRSGPKIFLGLLLAGLCYVMSKDIIADLIKGIAIKDGLLVLVVDVFFIAIWVYFCLVKITCTSDGLQIRILFVKLLDKHWNEVTEVRFGIDNEDFLYANIYYIGAFLGLPFLLGVRNFPYEKVVGFVEVLKTKNVKTNAVI